MKRKHRLIEKIKSATASSEILATARDALVLTEAEMYGSSHSMMDAASLHGHADEAKCLFTLGNPIWIGDPGRHAILH